MKTLYLRACQYAVCAAAFSLTLAGCGDAREQAATGAKPPQAASAQTQAKTLSVTVTANGQPVVGQDGLYVVPDRAETRVQCNIDCTFSTQPSGVQTAQEDSDSRQWRAILSASAPSAKLVLTASAAGQAPVTVTLQPVVARSDSHWSLDKMGWRRGASEQRVARAQTPAHTSTYNLYMQSDNWGTCSMATPCSIITATVFNTIEPGDFAADPNWLTAPGLTAKGIRINIKVVTAPSVKTDYRPSGGTVRITKDAAGTYHFSTVGSIPVVRTGRSDIAGMPEQMAFTMTNGH